MKKTALLLVLVVAGVGLAQQMDMKPPKEMAQADFFLGSWKGNMTFFEPGGQQMKSTGAIVGRRTMGGRYVQSDHTYTMGPQKFYGMHLLSYDPMDKSWKAWWFDSTAAGVMELSGNWSGKSLVMVSKPTPMPGMGDQTFRSTYVKAGAKKMDFTLEMKGQDGKWSKMIVGSYTKK